jgi:hypothetical protein
MATTASPGAPPVPLVLALLPALGWGAALTHLPGVAGDPLAIAVLALGQLAATAVETATLLALAPLHRARLHAAPTLLVLLTLSLTQALTLYLAAAGRAWPQAAPALAVLAGPAALHTPGQARDGFALAFTYAGLLTALRLAGTVLWLVRHHAPWPRAGATVLACYGAVRLATAWTADLLRGASPLG